MKVGQNHAESTSKMERAAVGPLRPNLTLQRYTQSRIPMA